MRVPPGRTTQLGHQPGLDGLRGLAVAAVLAFHLRAGWARGGYLGVSVFFTLSGFLITALLLGELRSTGGVSLRSFWARRARRLLPAGLIGLALAVFAARVVPNGTPAAGGDVLASLGQVANWRFLFSGRSYGGLFSSPSPVVHYWSLSIEEQFYVLYPLAVVFALRRSRRALVATIFAGLAASWTALLGAGILGQRDFAYYSTLTRAGELLAGAALALVVLGRPAGHGAAWRRAPIAGVAALVGLGTLVATLDQGNRFLELGALPLTSVLSVVVILAACQPGPVRSLLSLPPLRGLGRISYGVYVYHWPLFLLLSAQRSGLRGISLVVLRIGSTLAAALLSYVLVERPVLQARRIRRATARRLLPLSYGALALLAVTVATSAQQPIDFSAALKEQARTATAATKPPQGSPAAPDAVASSTVPTRPSSASTPTSPTTEPPRIAMFGDSTALMTGIGVARWGYATGRLKAVAGVTPLGCGIGRGGERRFRGNVEPVPSECNSWARTWPQNLAGKGATVAVIESGEWDVSDRLLPGDSVWRHIGDPVYDTYLRAELFAAVDLLRSQGLRVVVLTNPPISLGQGDPVPPARPFPESDPARMARLNEMWRAVASERAEVRVVDLAGYLARLPGGEMDPSLRPDGVHFSETTALKVAEWLGPAIIAASSAP